MRSMFLSVAVIAAPITIAAPAHAAPTVKPFNQAAFDAAQKAGKPILGSTSRFVTRTAVS